MELMDKLATNDGPILVREISSHWSPEAVRFLSIIESGIVYSIDELIKVNKTLSF
jgi:hypothetical protein